MGDAAVVERLHLPVTHEILTELRRPMALALRCISILVTLSTLAGCVPKHPVELLQRDAKKFEREFAKTQAETSKDSSFFVPVSDGTTAAAQLMAETQTVVDVGPTSVGCDWTYSGAVGLDEGGEYMEQARSRLVAAFETTGAELVPLVTEISGRRVLRVDEAADWSEARTKGKLPGLSERLGELELRHLKDIRVPGNPAELIADFARSVPPGFDLDVRTATVITVQKVSSKRRDKPKKEWWATWESRETLRAEVDVDGKYLIVTSVLHHRYNTEEAEGDWSTAPTQNSAAAVDWTANALRLAIPAGRASFAPALLASPAAEDRRFSAPPRAPRLRSISEVADVVRLRAFAQRRGDFTVCVDHVIVNPKSASGYDWDLPGVSEVVSASESLAAAGEEVVGELNAVAERQPIVAALADGGMAYLTGDTVDRRQLESILRVTKSVAGWTNKHLPVKPDLRGSLDVGGTVFPIDLHDDSLRIDPEACADLRLGGGGVIAALELWDDDLSEDDLIGKCAIGPEDVFDRGLTGIPCGFARVYASAQFRFSLAQVKLLGLPPAE